MPVYFIQEGDDGPIKIGFTLGNPHSRLRDLQTGNPRPLRLLVSVSGSQREEAALHERFAALRLQGEWFRQDSRLLGFVEGLRYIVPDTPGPTPTVVDACGLTIDQFQAIAGYLDAREASLRADAALTSTGDRDDGVVGGELSSLLDREILVNVAEALGALSTIIDMIRGEKTPYAAGAACVPGGLAGLLDDLEQVRHVLDRHHHALADDKLSEAWRSLNDPTPLGVLMEARRIDFEPADLGPLEDDPCPSEVH